MNNKLYTKFKYWVAKFLRADAFKTELVELCGIPLNTVIGTIRKKEDQDDAWWFYLSQNHDCIFDIGCNIGYTALLTLIQNPDKRIVLIDPNPDALKVASHNLINNNLGSKAHFLSAFVSDKVDDKIKFYTVGFGAAGSMYASHAVTASKLNSHIEVRTVTVDYLVDFYNWQPDLLKIDVEGAETFVVKGITEKTLQYKPSIFVEVHKVEKLGIEGVTQQLLDWCKIMNYKAWYLETGTVLESVNSIKHRGKYHLLLLPDKKQFPEYLKGIVRNASLPKINK